MSPGRSHCQREKWEGLVGRLLPLPILHGCARPLALFLIPGWGKGWAITGPLTPGVSGWGGAAWGLRGQAGTAGGGGGTDLLLRLWSLPGSSPVRGPRVEAEEQGLDCQPYSGRTEGKAGAKSPKACLRSAQDACAHLLPSTYRPSSSDGAEGHRVPGVTGRRPRK